MGGDYRDECENTCIIDCFKAHSTSGLSERLAAPCGGGGGMPEVAAGKSLQPLFAETDCLEKLHSLRAVAPISVGMLILALECVSGWISVMNRTISLQLPSSQKQPQDTTEMAQ